MLFISLVNISPYANCFPSFSLDSAPVYHFMRWCYTCVWTRSLVALLFLALYGYNHSSQFMTSYWAMCDFLVVNVTQNVEFFLLFCYTSLENFYLGYLFILRKGLTEKLSRRAQYWATLLATKQQTNALLY